MVGGGAASAASTLDLENYLETFKKEDLYQIYEAVFPSGAEFEDDEEARVELTDLLMTVYPDRFPDKNSVVPEDWPVGPVQSKGNGVRKTKWSLFAKDLSTDIAYAAELAAKRKAQAAPWHGAPAPTPAPAPAPATALAPAPAYVNGPAAPTTENLAMMHQSFVTSTRVAFQDLLATRTTLRSLGLGGPYHVPVRGVPAADGTMQTGTFEEWVLNAFSLLRPPASHAEPMFAAAWITQREAAVESLISHLGSALEKQSGKAAIHNRNFLTSLLSVVLSGAEPDPKVGLEIFRRALVLQIASGANGTDVGDVVMADRMQQRWFPSSTHRNPLASCLLVQDEFKDEATIAKAWNNLHKTADSAEAQKKKLREKRKAKDGEG